MQLEGVRRVSVRDLGLEVGRQVDYGDCIERALLRADTASDTQALRDESDLGLGCNLYAKLAGTDYRTALPAFLPAFLRFALEGKCSSVATRSWCERRGGCEPCPN